MYKSRDFKGDKTALLPVEISNDPYVWGTFPNVASLSVLLEKNNVRPTISASKNLNYRPHRQSGQWSNIHTCQSTSRPAPYSEKHLFAVSHWLTGITVSDLQTWLVALPVCSLWRDGHWRCGGASVARQLTLEPRVSYRNTLKEYLTVYPTVHFLIY